MEISAQIPNEICAMQEGAAILNAVTIGHICFLRLRVTGNIFEPDTDYTIGNLNKLKPAFKCAFALAGDSNIFTGNVGIYTDGKIVMRVSEKTGYFDTCISYPTDDVT